MSSKSVNVFLAIFLKYQSSKTFVALAAHTMKRRINITSQEANKKSFNQTISFLSNTVSPARIFKKYIDQTIPDKIKKTTSGPPVTKPIRLKRPAPLFLPALNLVFISISNTIAAAKDVAAKAKDNINVSLYSEKVITFIC